MIRLLKISSVVFLLFIAISSFAQIKNNFTQIDSIVNSNMNSFDTDSFFVAHQIWFVGSRSSNKQYFYDNLFEIIVYYKQKEFYYIKKIDNFGNSKSVKYDSKNIEIFLEDNFIKMEQEELLPRTDTLFINESTIKVISTQIDHQREDKIWISYKGKKMVYYFPAEFDKNKFNLPKKKYLFLKMVKRYSEKKSKRLKTK